MLKNKNVDLMEVNQHNVNARGGTELLGSRLYDSVSRDVLKECQIFLSRVGSPLKEDKIRVLWCHDLPNDPEAQKVLSNDGWRNFHKIVFVSNWQMQAFLGLYNIPWSKCVVMKNAIYPIEKHQKPEDGKLRLCYYSTPQRGLAILVPVFKKLCEKYNHIELNVYSSFDLYGWNDRDKEFAKLFEECNHPQINYNKSISNDEMREILKKQNILVYPSIWQETSCLVLMEAMSAGLICVHPNFGALYETAANWTIQYQWQEEPNKHAGLFYTILDNLIQGYNFETYRNRLVSQKNYADAFYNWNLRGKEWEALLTSMLGEPREISKSAGSFNYKF